MNNDELEPDPLARAETLHRVRRRITADNLADAAEKLGKCGSADAGKPEHHKQCARCAVKVAVQLYREARQ